MALADMVLVLVEIAEVVLIKLKNNVMTKTFNSENGDEDQIESLYALDDRIILTCK